MSDAGGTRFDRIARDLASGDVSRRSALKRLAAAGLGLGAAMAPAGVAEAMAPCPGNRVKCDGKCCPKNARCRQGRCRCKPGYKKCGRKCVDVQSSVKHCGGCNSPCADGETCIGGVCSECTTAAQCPPAATGSCQTAACINGACTTEDDDTNLPNDSNQCTSDTCVGGAPAHNPLSSGTPCGENGGTMCDGGGNCVQCLTPADCPGQNTTCSSRTCESGVCGTTFHTDDLCGSQTCGGGNIRDLCCSDTGQCTQVCSTCYCAIC